MKRMGGLSEIEVRKNLHYFFIIMQGTGHLGLLLAGHVGTLIGCFDHT